MAKNNEKVATHYTNMAKYRIFSFALKYALSTKEKSDVKILFSCFKKINIFGFICFLLSYIIHNKTST